MKGLSVIARVRHTSYRALSTENGFKAKPTETRVTAPAMRLPWLVSLGSVEPCLPASEARTDAKYGDVAMNVRSWLRPVKYRATPGTFLCAC